MVEQKVWFITGTSTGLGRALSEAVVARGDKLVATVRREGTNRDLVERAPDRIKIVQLDVTRPEQIPAAVTSAKEAFGRIDVLVNNAGYMLFGAVEEMTDEQIRRQIETDLIGPILIARAVLPLMREQRSGHIIQISSLGGQIVLPGLSMYHAAKWGVEGFAEALAIEVAPFGIQVTIIEPGAMRTEWAGRSMDRTQPLEAYAQTPVGQIRQQGVGAFVPPGDPVKIAKAIINAVDQEPSPTRLTLGSDAYPAVRSALQARLAALEAQEALALSTDADDVVRSVN